MTAVRAYAGLVRWLVVAGVVVIGSGVAGWWLANVTAPRERVSSPAAPRAQMTDVPTTSAPIAEAFAPPEPPVYFYVNTLAGTDRALTGEEIAMAAQAGIHQYIVSFALPWSDEADEGTLDELVDWVLGHDPQAAITIELYLDPPLDWLAKNPDESIKSGERSLPYVSPASEIWRSAVTVHLEQLLQATISRETVTGFVLACLEEGTWMLSSPFDESQANVKGFRHWLTTHFLSDTALQEAWGDSTATLAAAAIPVAEDAESNEGADGLSFPPMISDYFRYVSETRADAISAFAKTIKATKPDYAVWARYGFTVTASGAGAGHFALGRLLALGSEVDGFIYPMAAVERGLGGAGGFAGPVHSILGHGKQCVLLDDTLTGLAKSTESGNLERMRGLTFESVATVHQRNFASALVHGLGVAWADPHGDGRLHDEDLWERFGAMRANYRSWYQAAHEQETTIDASHGVAFPPGGPGLAVIIDERARSRGQSDVQEALLRSVVGAVHRAGVETQFWLLEDFLSGQSDEMRVYLFANVFYLSESERQRIHDHLRESDASAIWMYTAGLTGSGADAADVSATTGIQVRVLDAPIAAGSQYTLDSQWITTSGGFGADAGASPRFVIEDANADVLANYVANGKPSVAFTTTDEQWSSVFIGEPTLSAELLRELLQLLDLTLVFPENAGDGMDVLYLGPHLLALHAAEPGSRALPLGMSYDVRNLFDMKVGWPEKPILKLDLAQYETGLFLLTPPKSAATMQGVLLNDVLP